MHQRAQPLLLLCCCCCCYSYRNSSALDVVRTVDGLCKRIEIERQPIPAFNPVQRRMRTERSYLRLRRERRDFKPPVHLLAVQHLRTKPTATRFSSPARRTSISMTKYRRRFLMYIFKYCIFTPSESYGQHGQVTYVALDHRRTLDARRSTRCSPDVAGDELEHERVGVVVGHSLDVPVGHLAYPRFERLRALTRQNR